MKKRLVILLGIFIAAFATLHGVVYRHVDDFNWPNWLIVSFAGEPLGIESLELVETKRPGYLNPFQKFTYEYAEKGRNDVVIVEQTSFLNTRPEAILGDPTQYHDEEVDGTFWRGFAGEDYVNTVFFLIQYVLIIASIGIVIKLFCCSKKS